MNARAEQDESRGHDEWSAAESAVLKDAVDCAPSVHGIRPWSLTIQNRTIVLREFPATLFTQHDPQGRDRRISCGAALENLVLATRGLGWSADVDISVAGGVVTATITSTRPARTTATEDRRRRAMPARRSHRHAFAPPGLPSGARDALLGALTTPGVSARWITDAAEAQAVARLLDYSARVFHDDAEYQRELELWATRHGGSPEPGSEGLAVVGLTTSQSKLPDEALLAARIQREAVLIAGTRSDEPLDHVQAGEALERAWLEATGSGLAASVMTQPLHLEEVRTGLADRLGLAFLPQMLMRFGHPAEPVQEYDVDMTDV